MRGRFAAFIGFAAVILSSGAFAMSGSGTARIGPCTVIGKDSLPASSGGANALCGAIERAIKAQAPTVHYSVEVKVISASRLSAVLVVNGKTLPEQRFAVMDRELNPGSIERFAQSLALVVGQTTT